MPLSEHEQRLLDQMERALNAEDPKFATSMRNPRPTIGDKRRAILGVVGFMIGMGLLLAGVATRLPAVGVVGFLAMLGGLVMVIGAFNKPGEEPSGSKPRAKSKSQQRPTGKSKQHRGESLTDRMEDRWRRRRETGDF
ncbi:MAG: DUF3040 domain-containing protein [Candidatus Nanopelagicales bacterium]